VVEWHPRQNAYPVAWELRNGRHAEPYAIVQAVKGHLEGRPVVKFELRTPSGQALGMFDTGDQAAEFAFTWYLEQARVQHRAAATRMHERGPVTTKANTPARVERD
jgi:hypothetical protein